MKAIMYIGKKPTKRDNVNNEPNRIWYGLGDVQTVTDAEALKLLQPIYKDVWMDVTDMDVKARTKIVEQLREKFRQEQRQVTPAGEIARALSILSTEEIEAELRRRRREDGKPDSNQAPAAVLAPNPESQTASKESKERPSSTDQLMDEIIGVLASLDKESRKHFDSKGQPILEAVNEKLGYKISQAELKAAVEFVQG